MPNFDIEDKYPNLIIAGVDEAGRGPLAGPVVAAAVIVDRNHIIKGINDSKKLKCSVREELYKQIIRQYIYAVGIVEPAEIDEINILEATKKACILAVSGLGSYPKHRLCHPELVSGSNAIREIPGQARDDGQTAQDDICLVQDNGCPINIILVDGNMKFSDERFISVIKGDFLSYSIAAASIVAKVTRDNIMQNLSKDFPQYNWHQNMGYGTKNHLLALEKFGPTPYHRKSFKVKFKVK